MDFASIFKESELIAGVEVTDSAIRLALAKRNKSDKIEIEFKAEQPLEPGVVFGGEVLKEPEFTEALKKLRADCPKNITSVVLTLSPYRTYSKVFTFPNNIHGQKLEETIRLTMEYQLPWQLQDSYSDFHVIHEGETTRVLVVSAPKERIDPFISAFAAANLPLLAVERYQVTLSRAVKDFLEQEKQGALVKVETPRGMWIVGYIDGVAYFNRFLPKDHASGENQANEIKNIFDYLNVEYGVVPKVVDRESLPLRSDVIFQDPDKQKWMLPIGAALRGLTPRSKDNAASLMPVSTTQAYEFHRLLAFSRRIAVVFATAAVFFVLAFIGIWIFMSSLQRQETSHVQTLDTPITADDSAVQTQIQHVNALVGVSAGILHARPEWSKVLIEVQSRITPGIVITNVDFPGVGQPMSITGIAQSRQLLNDFKGSLEKSTMLTAVQLPLTNLDQLANIPFSITFSLTDPNSIYSQ